jgi:hypothetical protein
MIATRIHATPASDAKKPPLYSECSTTSASSLSEISDGDQLLTEGASSGEGTSSDRASSVNDPGGQDRSYTHPVQKSGKIKLTKAPRARKGAIQGTKQGQACDGLVIFDFDDTLLPTSWLKQKDLFRAGHGGSMTKNSVAMMALKAHAQLVEETLRAGRATGKVSIVTLASESWVESSARDYLPGIDWPGLLRELDITVYHARKKGCSSDEEAVQRKQESMARCVQDWRDASGQDSVAGVLSIGDSKVEREALVRSLGAWPASSRPVCKTLKLMDAPSLSDLSKQLRHLIKRLKHLATSTKGFDIAITDPAKMPEKLART